MVNRRFLVEVLSLLHVVSMSVLKAAIFVTAITNQPQTLDLSGMHFGPFNGINSDGQVDVNASHQNLALSYAE